MATVAKIKVTAKSIITNGIKSGWTIARIVKEVKKKIKGSKITEQVVRIYASTLCANKEITAEQKSKYLKRSAKKKAAPKKKVAAKKKVVKKKAAPKKKVAAKKK